MDEAAEASITVIVEYVSAGALCRQLRALVLQQGARAADVWVVALRDPDGDGGAEARRVVASFAALSLGLAACGEPDPEEAAAVKIQAMHRGNAARKEMKEDLKFMAYLAVPYRFLKAEVFKLFESKWAPRVPKVVERLCKQYMRSNATARFWMSCDTLPGMPNHNNALEGLNGRHKEEATEWEKKPVAEYFNDHCEWFEDKAHQHWAFATKAEHKPKDWKMAQDILEHTNSIEASWKCEIQLTASPFEPAKSTEVFFILANATYKGIAHDYGAELPTIKSHAKPIYESVASLHKEGPGTKSLDELKRLISKVYILYPARKGAATTVACTCKHYQKRETCCHSLAYDIYTGAKEIPATEDQRAIPHIKSRKARPGGALTNDQVYSIPEITQDEP